MARLPRSKLGVGSTLRSAESGELPAGIHAPVDILVVDDRLDDANAMRIVLEDPGYNVILPHSGPEALRHVLQRDFAVILLDIINPSLDGYELATMIKQGQHRQHTHIIFVTAA